MTKVLESINKESWESKKEGLSFGYFKLISGTISPQEQQNLPTRPFVE